MFAVGVQHHLPVRLPGDGRDHLSESQLGRGSRRNGQRLLGRRNGKQLVERFERRLQFQRLELRFKQWFE
jgi:hypothetical protein